MGGLRLPGLVVEAPLDCGGLVFVRLVIVIDGRGCMGFNGLSELAERIERPRNAPDAEKLEQAAQAACKAAILIGIDWLTCRPAAFHTLKLALKCRGTLANANRSAGLR